MAVNAASQAIVATRDPDVVVAHLLRAMRDPLGFARAIYFTVDRQRGIEPKCQIDGSDVVEPSDERLDTESGSVVLGVLRGDIGGVGRAGELSAPLVDVRRWYALSALAGTDGAFGALYVDGHRTDEPSEPAAELVRNLSSIAATTIENARLFARTQELATRDPLTGLYNRRAFAERLEDALRTSSREHRSLAYVMIDVDDFKSINDRAGHAHGDDVLRKLAATLLASSRAEDVVGRYAGDEFAVLINGVDANLARTLVGRLSADLRARDLRCSLGAALYPHDASTARDLMEAADRALYNTKAAGKNGYSFF